MAEGGEHTDWENCPAVERKPGRIGGAWAFTGTLVPVYALFENLASGAMIDEFVEWFPDVDKQQEPSQKRRGAARRRGGGKNSSPTLQTTSHALMTGPPKYDEDCDRSRSTTTVTSRLDSDQNRA